MKHRNAFIRFISVFMSVVLVMGTLYPATVRADESTSSMTDYSMPEEITTEAYYDYKQGTYSMVGLEWDEREFAKEGDVYNHTIARMCATLSMLAYGYSIFQRESENHYIKTLKEQLGFKDVIPFVWDTEGNSVCYSLAYKTILLGDDVTDLVVLTMRGTYRNEWITNFDPGEGSIHASFKQGAEDAYQAMKSYISKNKLGENERKLKILVTGHSRGAAVANIIGKMILDDDLLPVETGEYINDIGKELHKKCHDLYDYSFATPNSTCDTDRHTYEGIYSIVNPEDFVTKVIPGKWASERYGRYGTTYILPSISTEDKNRYEIFYEGVNQKVLSYRNEQYLYYGKGDSGGEKGILPVYSYVEDVTGRVTSINEYYNKKLGSGSKSTLKNLYESSLGYYMCGDDTKKTRGLINLVTAPAYYGSLGLSTLNFFVMHEAADRHFECAHLGETYLAAMNTVSENDLKRYKRVLHGIVSYPADVEITLSGNTVAATVGDKAYVYDDSGVQVMIVGDSKQFYLPGEGSYDITLTGSDDDCVDYTLCEIDADIGEVSRIVYKGLPAAKDGSYGMKIDSEASIEKQILINPYGETLTADSLIDEINGDITETFDVIVTVEGMGMADSVRGLLYGDCAQMRAVSCSNNEFYGWYDESGNLLSTEPEYSFVPNKTVNLTARFSDNPVGSTDILNITGGNGTNAADAASTEKIDTGLNKNTGNSPIIVGKGKLKKIKYKSGRLKLKWKKASNAAYYEVQTASNRKFTKSKKKYKVYGASVHVTLTVKQRRKFKGRMFYVRIRGCTYDADHDRIVSGAWSNPKKVS